MISYLQAVDVIRTFAINHLQIQRFGFEFREQMPNIVTTEESFPYLFVVPVGSNSLQNVREIDFDVYCVDKYQSERNNVPYIISDTDLILADLTLWLEEGQDDIEVVRSYSITPINNDLLDYVGGHVMRLRVQVDRIALCEIPFDGDAPVPPVCPSGFVRNSDNTYTEIVLSGGTLVLPDITVTDSDGSTFTQPAVQDVTCTLAPPCDDATYSITDDSLNVLYSGSIPSGGNLDQVIQDSTVSITDDSLNVLHTVSVNAEGSASQVIADSTAVLKTTSNVTLSTTSINAEASADILAPDTSIEINGVAEGSVVAGSTVDIQLSDSLGVVTPLSVTQTGNDFAVVLPDAPAAVTRSTATLTQTGQTTVFRTGDDADTRAEGRATDFLTLDAAPLHNDGSATLNTTTNRFTDTLGGSTYADDIVLDWSTWNGSTLLGWDNGNGGGYTPTNLGQADNSWNSAIDGCLAHTNGSFITGWRCPNLMEMLSVRNFELTSFGDGSGLFVGGAGIFWTSTTYPVATTQAFRVSGNSGVPSTIAKTTTTTSYRVFPIRTFSLSTLNVLS